jgi:glucose/arabinose dehydrogenase
MFHRFFPRKPSTRNQKSRKGPSWNLNALELRLMLAGDAGVAVSGAAEQSSVVANAIDAGQQSLSGGTLVIVDSSVKDLDLLSESMTDDAVLVVIPSGSDGIAVMSQTITRYRDIGAIHLFTHGSDGQLNLGIETVDSDTLEQRADQLRSWRASLSKNADLMIYGCDLAASNVGRTFIAKLGLLTGADIAASTNRTGSQSLGADFVLEHTLGSIETDIIVSHAVAERFRETLGIVIHAAGQTQTERMELRVNGQVVESWVVSNTDANSGQFQTFSYNVDGISPDDIRIHFVNDRYDPSNGFDRNLRIDRIDVDGVTYQTESPSVFSTGTWTPTNGVTPGFHQSEYLTHNGYFQFSTSGNDPGSGSNRIEIDVRGTTGDEDFQLLIDGTVVHTYSDIGTIQRTLGFNTNQSVSADSIRIAFINSVHEPLLGYDQNLIVDKIRVNGQTFQTEAASTFSTGTYVEGQGIVPGNWQSEILHADGYFQFNAGVPTPATSIAFEFDNFIVSENVGSVTLTVVRQGDVSGQSTVNYSVPGGFAIPDQDFRRVTGTLTFDEGQSRKTFSVPIINDTVAEGIETFTVALDGVNGANFGTNRTTIVTINDDDNAPNPPGSLNVQLPQGFTTSLIDPSANFAGPTGLKVASDGRVFVVEKFGKIYVVENGQRVGTPFLDLGNQVYSVGTSQGLAGFALDPNFSSNGHVYVLYTASENGVRFGRLERYTVSSSNRNQIDPSTRRILIGTNASNGFPDGGDIHLVGDLQFGNDGSLLISYGDAAPNGDNNAAFNAQNLDNLGGVIARVNPNNGEGYASNPFYTGNPNDVRSKIWAYGLRNPYRFAVASDGSTNPDDGRPGTLYIGDVQFQTAEEINVARGGENFGWPYFQGNQRFLGNEDPANFTGPEVAFPRAVSQTSIAGAFIEGGNWPGSYQNNYLHADYTAGWIKLFSIDDDGSIIGQRDFATGARGITDLEWDPVSQRLYFVALNQANGFRGELYAISFADPTGGGFVPTEISTGSDGVAFAVTKSEKVYRRDGDNWTQLSGAFTKIAARNANEVWGIDAFGNTSRFNGSSWERVNGTPLKDISVSSSGEVWGIGLGNNVLRRSGNQWIVVSGTLVDIEIGDNGVVYGVNATGQIWQYANNSWTRINGVLTDISIGDDGSIWGTNAQKQVWRRVGNLWQQQNVSLDTISAVNSTDAWGVNANAEVYRWNGSVWQIDGEPNTAVVPTEISTGSDGVAFAVTNSEKVYRRDGDNWTQLPGAFTKVAARNANEVWGIDALGNTSLFNGTSWEQVNGIPLKDISVSSSGEVWGIGLENNVLRRSGNQWIGVSGSLVDIEVGDDGVVYGVNATGQIWQYANSSWARIGGVLTDISIGDDGSIWGTNAQKQVWRRVGNVWQLQNVSLDTISVVNSTDAWGVNANAQVRRWNGSEWQIISIG